MASNDLSVRLNTLNMRQLDFNIIFQPPKEGTSDLVIKSVALIRGFTVGLEPTLRKVPMQVLL